MKKYIALSLLLITSFSYAMDDANKTFPPASQEQAHTCSEFFCEKCNQSFESEDIYDEMTHMENVHHLCTVCGETFDSGAAVRWHHAMTHIKKEDLKPHGLE